MSEKKFSLWPFGKKKAEPVNEPEAVEPPVIEAEPVISEKPESEASAEVPQQIAIEADELVDESLAASVEGDVEFEPPVTASSLPPLKTNWLTGEVLKGDHLPASETTTQPAAEEVSEAKPDPEQISQPVSVPTAPPVVASQSEPEPIEAAAPEAPAPFKEEKTMGVKSTKEYPAIHRDRQETFGPVQILYFCWEGHMLFAPSMALVAPPETPLGEVIKGQLAGILKIDPDASKIDWDNADWYKDGQPVQLDYSKSLVENGLKHKHQIMLKTPGLNTICGTAA